MYNFFEFIIGLLIFNLIISTNWVEEFSKHSTLYFILKKFETLFIILWILKYIQLKAHRSYASWFKLVITTGWVNKTCLFINWTICGGQQGRLIQSPVTIFTIKSLLSIMIVLELWLSWRITIVKLSPTPRRYIGNSCTKHPNSINEVCWE